MNTRHLSQRELAERWTLSPRTLERWRWLGVGPRFLKLGGRVVHRIADIAAFEAAQLRTRTDIAVIQEVEEDTLASLKRKQKATQIFARLRSPGIGYNKLR